MDNLCSSRVFSKNHHPRPPNAILLFPYGPTDRNEYLRRQTKKKVIEFVHRMFIEVEVEEAGEKEEGEVEEGAGETFLEWTVLEFVYENEDEEKNEEEDEEEDEEDEGEGDMESLGMAGPGLESMDQVVQTLEPDGDIFSDFDISREEIENYEPFADICRDWLGSMDILAEFFESDLEDGK